MLNISGLTVSPASITSTDVTFSFNGYIIHVSDNPIQMELNVLNYPDVCIVEGGIEKQSCTWNENFVVYPGASYNKTVTLRIKNKPTSPQACGLRITAIDATSFDQSLNTHIIYQ